MAARPSLVAAVRPKAVITPSWSRRLSRASPSYSSLSEQSQPRKTAIITGASGGIGSAIAHRFALEGLNCVLVGRNTVKLHATYGHLLTTDTHSHSIQIGNVSDEAFWSGVSKTLKHEGRNCDVLVNAAGLTHASFLVRTQKETADEIINTNLMGTILGCKSMLKSSMVPRRQGCIINVASLLALRGGRGAAVYAASKAGVLGLTRALVAETAGTRIRVNCILPGYVTTAMTSEGRSEASCSGSD